MTAHLHVHVLFHEEIFKGACQDLFATIFGLQGSVAAHHDPRPLDTVLHCFLQIFFKPFELISEMRDLGSPVVLSVVIYPGKVRFGGNVDEMHE